MPIFSGFGALGHVGGSTDPGAHQPGAAIGHAPSAQVRGKPMGWWPSSIRGQLLAGLLLLEVLSVGLFAAVLTRQQIIRGRQLIEQRLAYEANALAMQSAEAMTANRPAWVSLSVNMTGQSPTLAFAKLTNADGKVLFVSRGQAEDSRLEPEELAQIPRLNDQMARVFTLPGNRMEGVRALYSNGRVSGFVWVQYDQSVLREQVASILGDILVFGFIWGLASTLLLLLMSRPISRTLAVLHRGTRALMDAPESSGSFPLPVVQHNEFAELIEAFNRMVASIDEQRSGLNDTLSMLDSMLANAPIGLAFFDRHFRFVRVNHVFSEMTGIPLSRHLGRTLLELLPQPLAKQLQVAVSKVFESEEPVRNLEFSGQSAPIKRPWVWLVSGYPVRTAPLQVRWVGMIVLDTSERKRNEDALRRTEKLAAAGRLAASIAHEINNPLEAITNLLYLLRNYCELGDPAMNYVEMAEHEARRIAEITQQTLRFYRQPTSPSRTNLADLLDSVLSLYQVRLRNQGIRVERRYDPETDLFCFAGELRQVIANLVSNAIDATAAGGRLIIRARRSCHWQNPHLDGVRFTVADTGIGFDPAVREHIFEAFFTTKEVTGTGLGLWVSHEIILKHHGLVHVRSRSTSSGKPSGTVFQLFFPDNQNLAAFVRQPIELSA
jgi:PAS domain S-box-containing protein